MNPQFESLWEFHQLFERHGIGYAVIGGLAVQFWGEPRFTRDVDITLVSPPEEFDRTVEILLGAFHSRIGDPAKFARENRILLLRAANGCEVDVSFGLPGYEEEMISRTVPYDLEAEKTVRFCGAEDLLIHKMVASRPRDLEDVAGIVARSGRRLDLAYVRKWLGVFGDSLAMPILENFESFLMRPGGPPPDR